SGQEAKAREVIEHTAHVVGATDERKARDRDYLSARTALELHRWKEAAALPIPAERKNWDDTTFWARAIGAARSGDVTAAEAALKQFTELVADREKRSRKEGYTASNEKPVDLREAEAWLAFAKGKSEEAWLAFAKTQSDEKWLAFVKTKPDEAWLAYSKGKFEEAHAECRAAADRQDKNGGESVGIPAREMLADMLLELKRPADALAEYKVALKSSPNRFDGLV